MPMLRPATATSAAWMPEGQDRGVMARKDERPSMCAGCKELFDYLGEAQSILQNLAKLEPRVRGIYSSYLEVLQ